ncbi:hypothetical protein AB0M36_28750 [Actinoplanes sp. NPDC051346]|uniref:NACHT N-terminal Helical domain 1-containing protein n=1 Tax=Actinoplanes sp. NPDC051346 TaxID=3155048 RepID=UPI003414B7DA
MAALESAALGVARAIIQKAAAAWIADRRASGERRKELAGLLRPTLGRPDPLTGLVDGVASELSLLAGHEFAGLEEGDRNAALLAVVMVFDKTDLSDEALFAVDVDAAKLAARLRAERSREIAAVGLSAAGQAFFDRMLTQSCSCYLRTIMQLPAFMPRAQAELIKQVASLPDQVADRVITAWEQQHTTAGLGYLSDRPAARSAYLEQVRFIAPTHLDGRDQELEDLAAFCTAPRERPYLWLRAPAWAGKSALMATFALNPPADTHLVSFFITARWPGQSDRAAFTEVVVEQLADLLDEPMPVLTSATRDARFLSMLARAAQACASSGQRLVLLIDGLDEDTGVTLDADSYSIASLLPGHPPSGMRVIVASRLNPPLPDDVPDDHPMRDAATTKRLSRSTEADVVRQDMVRELTRLLRGSAEERELLGLLTAAGGGLSVHDLAELIGVSAWDMSRGLATVASRSVAPRTGHWTGPDVYVLAHEELRQLAVERLGDARLVELRQRVHDWADSYRDQGWPATTPEFLLRGYHRLLQATADLPRLLACATDPRRHDRLLEVNGGDIGALTEISVAQDHIMALGEPDLVALSRLAVHRTRLLSRGALPGNLPAVWARLGFRVRAEAITRSIRDSAESDSVDRAPRRRTALLELARARARDHHMRGVNDLIRAIDDTEAPGPDLGDDILLRDIALSVLDAGFWAFAEDIARRIADAGTRASTMDRLAATFRDAGDDERAEALIAGSPNPADGRSEAAAKAVDEPRSPAWTLADQAEKALRTGARDTALALARQAELAAHTKALSSALIKLGERARATAVAELAEARATPDLPGKGQVDRRLIARLLRTESWTYCLDELSVVEPSAVVAIADEFTRIRSGSPG